MEEVTLIDDETVMVSVISVVIVDTEVPLAEERAKRFVVVTGVVYTEGEFVASVDEALAEDKLLSAEED